MPCLYRLVVYNLLILCLMVAAACQPKTELPIANTPFITSLNCVEVLAKSDSSATCRPIETNSLLLQSTSDQQMTLVMDGIHITFDSTLYIQADPGKELTLVSLVGTAVVSSGGITRIVAEGYEVVIPLDEGLRSTFAPLETLPFDYAQLEDAPLDELTQPVSIGSPPPEDTPVPTPTEIGECERPDDWSQEYIIQRGDNLTRIANLHQISVSDLQTYNCLSNPNRIRPGDVLFVFASSTPTPVPDEVTFTTDTETLAAGECATVIWQTSGARLVSFQGSPVARQFTANVCPPTTTTYTLIVLFENGDQREYTLTITVETG